LAAVGPPLPLAPGGAARFTATITRTPGRRRSRRQRLTSHSARQWEEISLRNFNGLSAMFGDDCGAAVSAAQDVVGDTGRRDACTTNLVEIALTLIESGGWDEYIEHYGTSRR
ncbi:MAG: hypothetical protein ACLQNE_39075, partial [Thermoguttaceae bacterium]